MLCGLASENSTYGISLINIVGLFPRHNVNATNNTKDGTGLITYIKKNTRFVDVRPLDHMLEHINSSLPPLYIHIANFQSYLLTMIPEFSPSTPQKLMAGQYIRAFLLLVPGTRYLSKKKSGTRDTHLDYLVPLTKTRMNRKYLVTHSNS